MLTLFASVISILIHYLLMNFASAGSWIFVIPHLLVICAILIDDYRIHKTFLSPLGLFILLYGVIVILPISLNDSPYNTLLLDKTRLEQGSLIYLWFLIICCLTYRIFHRRKNNSPVAFNQVSGFDRVKRYYQVALFFSIFFLALDLYSLISVGGLNLIEFIQNPISKIDARQNGANFLSYFSSAAYILFVIFYVLMFIRRKLSPLGIVIGALLIIIEAFLSGGKFQFFVPIIAFLMVAGFAARQIKFKSVVMLGLAGLMLIPVLFAWRGAFSIQSSNIVQSLITYNQIFYYSSRTFVEISPKLDNFVQSLSDLLITPIPRILWPEKPMELGLTRRMLEYKLISNNLPVNRSFSTMGLAEIWAALGFLGIVVSGFIMGIIIALTTAFIENPRTIWRFAFSVFMVISLYPILRVGFLNTYAYNILFTFIIAFLFDKIALLLYNNRRLKLAPAHQKPKFEFKINRLDKSPKSRWG